MPVVSSAVAGMLASAGQESCGDAAPRAESSVVIQPANPAPPEALAIPVPHTALAGLSLLVLVGASRWSRRRVR